MAAITVNNHIHHIDSMTIDLCIKELKKPGAVLLLPTDTVYGLVCRWNDTDALSRIKKMKKREESKPFQMLAPDILAVIKYNVIISPEIKKITDKFSPGALTIIAPLKNCKSKTANTVGFRIPNYPFITDLMRKSECVLAATSANIAGTPPAKNIEEALNTLNELPDIIVDAGEISTSSSTVIDMTENTIKLIRAGTIKQKDLQLCLQD